jgi:hypothetical protein
VGLACPIEYLLGKEDRRLRQGSGEEDGRKKVKGVEGGKDGMGKEGERNPSEPLPMEEKGKKKMEKEEEGSFKNPRREEKGSTFAFCNNLFDLPGSTVPSNSEMREINPS